MSDIGEVTIREMERGEEFAEWFEELLLRHEEETGSEVHHDDRYLVLTNEIGDWIGGLRFSLQGGVAHLQELAVTPQERHQGHAHRLLDAFEQSALEAEAHLLEFWTEDLRSEAMLSAFGWQRVLRRDAYIGGRTWYLMEKRIGAPVLA